MYICVCVCVRPVNVFTECAWRDSAPQWWYWVCCQGDATVFGQFRCGESVAIGGVYVCIKYMTQLTGVTLKTGGGGFPSPQAHKVGCGTFRRK